MSDLAVARNCCMARMLPGEADNGVGMTRSVMEGESVKRFERSNGLDTALYKNYLYLLCDTTAVMRVSRDRTMVLCKRGGCACLCI